MDALPNHSLFLPEGSLAPAQRLENGGILVYPDCPFALPEGADRHFLYAQQVHGRFHKNIAYNPSNGRVTGHVPQAPEGAERLHALLADFAGAARRWLADLIPSYAASWRLDRVSYRPEEEALRKLRPTARNDLLHFDTFPTRPSHGARLLRLFVNLHASEPRVWATSDDFATLLQRYGPLVGLPEPAASWPRRLLQLFQPRGMQRSTYDHFMLKFHHFLKANDDFQERSAKHLWHFPPGAAWLAFTDGLSYAELRGQFALEHSFFVPASALVRPDLAPAAILERACGGMVTRAA